MACNIQALPEGRERYTEVISAERYRGSVPAGLLILRLAVCLGQLPCWLAT